MRRTTWMLLLLLAVVAWTAESGAGWFDRRSRDQDHDRPQPHRYSDTPRRVLLAGELRAGSRGTWLLGDRELRLLPGCRIEIGGEPSRSLVAAPEALVLGTPIGGVVLARQVRVGRSSPAGWESPTDEQRYGIEWSGANPDVGVGTIRGVE